MAHRIQREAAAPAQAGARENRPVPILMYHSISDQATPRFRTFATRPEAFAEQMAYLAAHNYCPITVTHLVRAIAGIGAALPARPVVLTFDDGFADFHAQAWPVLAAHGFTGTLYVCAGHVNGTSAWLRREGEARRPMLSWEQLSDLAAHGIECGSHSHSHPRLDCLPAAQARAEIARSRAILEDRLAAPVSSFAYPFGSYNPAVRHMVQSAGYSSACAVRYAMSSTGDDVFALARLIVTREIGLGDFARLLEGRGAPGIMLRRVAAQGHQFMRHALAWGRG